MAAAARRRHAVDGIVYADERMMADIRDDEPQAGANVAHLPGIVGASLAMPDIHWGYGFPIGGVAATDADEGVRLARRRRLRHQLRRAAAALRASRATEVAPRMREIVGELFRHVPTGVGQGAARPAPRRRAIFDGVLEDGAAWAVARGLGTPRDLEHIEEGGCLPDADPALVSDARARARPDAARHARLGQPLRRDAVRRRGLRRARRPSAFGLRTDQVTVMIHSGSRGLGHQVCDDHLRVMLARHAGSTASSCPIASSAARRSARPRAKRYLAAMAAAANFAFANRQVMTHWARESLTRALGISPDAGRASRRSTTSATTSRSSRASRSTARRGACASTARARPGPTRPGHPQMPAAYRDVGQPVIIPGDMGRYSYVLAGTAARQRRDVRLVVPRRRPATEPRRREADVDARSRSWTIWRERGVVLKAAGMGTVAEEMPEAYKDVAEVVGVMDGAGISTRVAQLRPLGVIKG